MSDRPIFTYQTRVIVPSDVCTSLDAYAALHGKVERSLFAALRAGQSVNSLKQSFIKHFGITARQFNAATMASWPYAKRIPVNVRHFPSAARL